MIATIELIILVMMIYNICKKSNHFEKPIIIIVALSTLCIGLSMITLASIDYNDKTTNNFIESKTKYEIEYLDENIVKLNNQEYKYIIDYDSNALKPYGVICTYEKTLWDYILFDNKKTIAKVYLTDLKTIDKK